MKKITVSLLAVAATLVFSCPIFAADDYQQSGKTGMMKSTQSGNLQSAQQVLGMTVVAKDGTDLGEIQDIKLDINSGRISYVTMSKGGMLGMMKENIAVPIEAFRFSPESSQAMLTVDRTMLEDAPKQANMSDEEFNRKLQSHYGVSPAWQQQRPQEKSMQKMEPMEEEKSMQEMDPMQKKQQ